jgi:hypothetical protein
MVSQQSVLVSSPIWDPRPDFCYCQTFAILSHWSSLYNLGMDRIEPRHFQQFLHCCILMVHCCGNVFTAPLPSSGRLLLNYSRFQPSCHIASSLRLLVLSSLQAYRHFFSEGTCLWHLWSSSQMAPQCRAGPDASPSGLDSVQPSLLTGWVSCCCSPTAPSGLSASSTIVLLRACPSSVCFCDWRSPVIVTGTSLEGWTSVLASAWWAALEPVPTRLSTVSRGPSNRTATTIAPSHCYFAVALHAMLSAGRTTWASLSRAVQRWFRPGDGHGRSSMQDLLSLLSVPRHVDSWPCFSDTLSA